MPSARSISGVQSLGEIAARSSSARILDLHSLAVAAADHDDHRDRPLFTHPMLNRTIIVKHHPRPGEYDYRPERKAVVTKVIFPFDADDLDLGGQFLLVDEPQLAAQITRQLDYTEGDIEHDLAVLGLIDSLPTLDPFLLREALTLGKFDIAPCYFRLSPADQAEMLGFVSEQVETLIKLCFSGPSAEPGKAERLSQLILAGGDNADLTPLREALRFEPRVFEEALFCWKAVLYYRWRSRTLAPDVKKTRAAIGRVDLSRFDPNTAPFVAQGLGRLEAMVADCERRIARMFKSYDDVFDSLARRSSPEPFRRMLVDGPRMFAHLGEHMGRLEQVVSYWRHQFPERRSTRQAPPDAVTEALRNILSALSIRPGFMDHGPATSRIWDSEDPAPASAPRRGRLRRTG